MSHAISLRDVQSSDFEVFFQQQLDPEATRMAAFPARDRQSFMEHWEKYTALETTIQQTIVFKGKVAGNIVCWKDSDKHKVGYWLGRDHWGQGIASAALSLFLAKVEIRPLFAHVAKHNIASIRVLEKCGFLANREGDSSDPSGEVGEELVMALA